MCTKQTKQLVQSAEHLDVPTNTTLRLTNQQVNNQPEPVSEWSTNQPDKIAGWSLDLSLGGLPASLQNTSMCQPMLPSGQPTNQNLSVNDPPTNQPDKITGHSLG